MIDSAMLSSLPGKSVKGPDGENVGNIADVYESTGGGGIFATVNTGLFGSGSSFFPLDTAELRGDDVVVPYSKSFVKDAPRVGNDEELTAQEEQRLFDYYSQDGYATRSMTGPTMGMTDMTDVTEVSDLQDDATATAGTSVDDRDRDRGRANEQGTVGHDNSSPPPRTTR